MSQYKVLFAREVTDVILSNPVKLIERDLVKYVTDLKENALKINKQVVNNLERAREIQKKRVKGVQRACFRSIRSKK